MRCLSLVILVSFLKVLEGSAPLVPPSLSLHQAKLTETPEVKVQHNAERRIVDPTTQAQRSVSRAALPQQQADNQNERQKAAMKFSIWVTGLSLASMFCIFSGVVGDKQGRYCKSLRKTCILLTMATIISGVGLMLLGLFSSPTHGWITILKMFEYVDLVLLTLTTFNFFILLV